MIFTSEPHNFSLVKKARLALNAKASPNFQGPRKRHDTSGAPESKVPGSKHVLSECEGSRSLAGSGQR